MIGECEDGVIRRRHNEQEEERRGGEEKMRGEEVFILHYSTAQQSQELL